MGAASLWAPGHIASGRPVPEAVVGAARLAALSERATVGTAVLLAPLYHPVIVAKQFAELDVATAGRMMLGVGVGGEYPSEFRACQTPIERRGARTDEAITIMRRLWTAAGDGDGEIDHAGPCWPFEGVGILPPPVQPGGPPVIVAGRKPPAMRRAGVLGDGWMPFLCSPDQYAESVRGVREQAALVGRDLSSFHWMCFVYVSVDDDPAEARRKAVAFIGAGQAGEASRFEAVVDRVAAHGTPTQVAARLEGVRSGRRTPLRPDVVRAPRSSGRRPGGHGRGRAGGDRCRSLICAHENAACSAMKFGQRRDVLASPKPRSTADAVTQTAD